MRKVLIPTDFSRNAWDAIAYAVDLFKNEPCEFYILNVYSLADFATDNLMVPQL
ncbi:MAG TPA: universal stress protein, partial [Flavobacteriaceae bacterium]|nr:universal stress protein [Flavobacteriaceae bacterium]